MLFILCLINTCIIYHVNLKWRIIASYNSERFVRREFDIKGKQGNIMKHWKSQGMSHWCQFRITLLILRQEGLGFIPCAGAKRAAGFPAESCRAALAKRGHCVPGRSRQLWNRGGHNSSRWRAIYQGPVPIARQLFAALPWRGRACLGQLWKLSEFRFSTSLAHHFFSIENIWGIAQSGMLDKYADHSQAELMFVEKPDCVS